MKNNLTCMNLSGTVGEILAANERVWIHKLLEDNPGLFDGFLAQSDEKIFRTMWHGEFPGKLLTGIAQTYLLRNDAQTKAVGERMVALFRQAQEPCGYLGPWPEHVRFDKDLPCCFDTEIWGKWDT